MAFLTGPSGAGKSTLLKLITLIEKPTRGTVLVNGQNTARVRRRGIPAFRQNIGIVFQDHKLLYDRSVFDNVALPLVIIGLGPREIARRVRAALPPLRCGLGPGETARRVRAGRDQVGLLGRGRDAPVTRSTGEQQRVGIARAVASRPAVIVAGEPTGNLDPELSLDIMRLFARFNEVGITLLIATHDLELIERFDCRRVRLADGLIDEAADAMAAS